jgi:hypothetical protein
MPYTPQMVSMMLSRMTAQDGISPARTAAAVNPMAEPIILADSIFRLRKPKGKSIGLKMK